MNGKITLYAVAGAPTVKGLIFQVSQAMEQGWEPFGSLTYGEDDTMTEDDENATQHFFQAMVQRESIVRTMQ